LAGLAAFLNADKKSKTLQEMHFENCERFWAGIGFSVTKFEKWPI
jgi:hypothetical protein